MSENEVVESMNTECYITTLNLIREKIELMSKFNQVKVLRILTKYTDVTLNENKYGIHINLTDLRKEIIDEINNYITYVNTQELTLHEVEQQKESFKHIYFSKDNKDNSTKNIKYATIS